MSATTTAAVRPVPAVGTTVQYTSKAGNTKSYMVVQLGWVVLNGAGQPFTLTDAQCPSGVKAGDKVPYVTKGGKALLCPVVERAVFLAAPNSSSFPFGVGVSRVVVPQAATPTVQPAVRPSAPQTAKPTAVRTPAVPPADHKAAFAAAAAHVQKAVVVLRAIGLTPDNGDAGRTVADLERIGTVLAGRAAVPVVPPALPVPATAAAEMVAYQAEQRAALAAVEAKAARDAVQAAAAQAAKPAAPVQPKPTAKPVDVAAVVKAALAVQTLAALTDAVMAAGLTCDCTDSGKMAKALTGWLTPAQPAAAQTAKPTARPSGGLAGYHALQTKCKAAGLSSKGNAAELTARLAAHKPAAQPAAPLTASSTVKATPMVAGLYVADGKGGFRTATEKEVWTLLDAAVKAGK